MSLDSSSRIRAILETLPMGCGHDLWRHEDYYPVYEAVARAADPESLFEIGTLYGASLIALVHGARRVERVGWVDLNAATLAPAAANLAAYCTAEGRTLTPQWSADRGLIDTFGHADLVHVDGDHTLEGCRTDLLALAALTPSWVLIDDYDYPAVREAVDAWAATCAGVITRVPRIQSRAEPNVLAVVRDLTWVGA